MFKTTVKFTDFIGNERETVLRFNLTEAELIKLSGEDKMFDTGYLAYISTEKNFAAMYKMVLKLILLSYGEMSEDATYFMKSEEITNRFEHSAMYQAFLDDLMDGEDIAKLQAFVLGVFPKKFAEEISKEIGSNTMSVVK